MRFTASDLHDEQLSHFMEAAMKRILPISLALALSAASAVVVAAEETPGTGGYEQDSTAAGSGSSTGMPSFEEADKDQSGSIEMSETAGIGGLDISAADTDHDGKLSRSEYEAAKQSHEKGRDQLKPEPGGVTR
jgi:hypothetical protein